MVGFNPHRVGGRPESGERQPAAGQVPVSIRIVLEKVWKVVAEQLPSGTSQCFNPHCVGEGLESREVATPASIRMSFNPHRIGEGLERVIRFKTGSRHQVSIRIVLEKVWKEIYIRLRHAIRYVSIRIMLEKVWKGERSRDYEHQYLGFNPHRVGEGLESETGEFAINEQLRFNPHRVGEGLESRLGPLRHHQSRASFNPHRVGEGLERQNFPCRDILHQHIPARIGKNMKPEMSRNGV